MSVVSGKFGRNGILVMRSVVLLLNVIIVLMFLVLLVKVGRRKVLRFIMNCWIVKRLFMFFKLVLNFLLNYRFMYGIVILVFRLIRVLGRENLRIFIMVLCLNFIF